MTHIFLEQYNLSYLIRSIALLTLFISVTIFAETRQEQVHQKSHDVMPFEMSKTTHIFKMTESGGIQRVIVKDPSASDQIALVQQHLKHETERFQQGNYSDPAKLHGADMPGLKDIQAGASKIKVTYANIPYGGEITFITTDLRLLTALHRWFGAQLSEHGADARSE